MWNELNVKHMMAENIHVRCETEVLWDVAGNLIYVAYVEKNWNPSIAQDNYCQSLSSVLFPEWPSKILWPSIDSHTPGKHSAIESQFTNLLKTKSVMIIANMNDRIRSFMWDNFPTPGRLSCKNEKHHNCAVRYFRTGCVFIGGIVHIPWASMRNAVPEIDIKGRDK